MYRRRFLIEMFARRHPTPPRSNPRGPDVDQRRRTVRWAALRGAVFGAAVTTIVMTGFLRSPVEATGRTAAGRNSKISAASAPQRPPTTKVPPPGPLHNAMVTTTPGARERYVYSTIGDSVTVASSPRNTSGNLRGLLAWTCA